MATASAAERTASPLGEAVTELCWMTGAGEPVGSELSLGLSVFFFKKRKREKEKSYEKGCLLSCAKCLKKPIGL